MNFKDVKDIIRINDAKNISIKKPYNQLTGEGCVGNRFKITIDDAPKGLNELYLPIEMKDLKVVQDLNKFKSIEKIYYKTGYEFTKEEYENFWINFCEIRHQYDFQFYCATLVTIRDKISSKDVNFTLNRGQRKLLSKFEKQRLAGLPIRVTLVKARQWGGSTLIQIYMCWIQLFHKKNWNSVISAHVKDASITIRSMLDRTINSMGAVGDVKFSVRPFAGTSNIKQVPERGCLITVGSAVEPDSVRSQDAKMAHLSEVAFYPNTDKQKTSDLVNSIIGSVPRVPLSMIVYESTANGIGDFFYNECIKAKKGETAFDFLFVAWYEIDIYRQEFNGKEYYNDKGRLTKGTIEDFIKSLTDYEKTLFQNYEECTLENIHWYRVKLTEMTSHADMKQEYPTDEIEAFQDSGRPVFRSVEVEEMRRFCIPPIAIGDIISKQPSNTSRIEGENLKDILTDVRFIPDEDLLEFGKSRDKKTNNTRLSNKLKVWQYPEKINVKNRYVVVVDTGGRSRGADWSVITVFDRFYMIEGGVPEVVAEWRGHIDHDILVWLSAQIAVLYDYALLVFESNTHETEKGKKDGDHSEFIFDTIARYYSNLYIRESSNTKISVDKPNMYGFHMNHSEKTKLVDNYTIMLRETGYYERDHLALDEARLYEKTDRGGFEAKQGENDDKLITRMIGCYICYKMDKPYIEEKRPSTFIKKVINESSF